LTIYIYIYTHTHTHTHTFVDRGLHYLPSPQEDENIFLQVKNSVTEWSCDNSSLLLQGFWLATGVFVKEKAEGSTCPLLSYCSLECLPIPCTLPSRPPSSMRWRNGEPKSIRASKWGTFNHFMPVPMFGLYIHILSNRMSECLHLGHF